MMDTLDRYLTKEYCTYFVLLLLSISVLYLGIDFFSRFWNLDLPMDRIVKLYAYKLPGAMEQFLPVACLFAILLTLTNMSRQNEILGLYGGGISRLRITSAFLSLVAVICTLSFLFFDKVVPYCAQKQILIREGKDVNNSISWQGYKGGRFWYRSGNIFLGVANYSQELTTLDDISIFLMDDHNTVVEHIRAKRAIYRNAEWILEDGHVVTYPPEDNYPNSKSFEVKRGVIRQRPSEFSTLKIIEDAMELRDLRKYIKRNQSFGLDTTEQQVAYHERLALVFTPLIFVLLGIPFAAHPLKTHSLSQGVGYCFLLIFLYLVLFRFSLSLGKASYLPAFLAAWLTNVLFLLYAGFRMLRK